MSDLEIFQCYMVGSYVYSVYHNKKDFNDHKITGDEDTFYYILGWNIQQSYSEAYNHIIDNIIE